MSDTHTEDISSLIARYTEAFRQQYTPRTSAVVATDTPPSRNAVHEQRTDLTDSGRLQVRVSTENEAVPIVGARVLVTRRDQGGTSLVRSMVTNENGLTELIELPAKDRMLSLSFGNEAPFATYDVDVTAEGYFQKRFTDLPIYGGVTAVQSVRMIPLPEAADKDLVLTYPQADK